MNKILAYHAPNMDESSVSSHRKTVLIVNQLLCELLDAARNHPSPHLYSQQILH